MSGKLHYLVPEQVGVDVVSADDEVDELRLGQYRKHFLLLGVPKFKRLLWQPGPTIQATMWQTGNRALLY